MSDAISIIRRVIHNPEIESVEQLEDQFRYTPMPADKMAARMGELMQLRSLIDNALKEYGDDATHAMLEGTEVPGFKLKKGRKTRKIVSDAVAIKELQQLGLTEVDFIERKLIGIPKIETVLKGKGFHKEDVQHALGKFVEETVGPYKAELQ